jgi:hypothetical protein
MSRKFKDLIILIGDCELDDFQKRLLKVRYIHLLKDFHKRCVLYSFIFHSCRLIVTVGSLFVPALLSIQYSKDQAVIGNMSEITEILLYWVTWVISLAVTISNGIFTLLKIDKKYYTLWTYFEQLQSEGWQFLQLTGRYSGILNHRKRKPTHSNQFLYFCYSLEKLKMKQVEDEYYKLSDQSNKKSNPPSNEEPRNSSLDHTDVLEPPAPVTNGGVYGARNLSSHTIYDMDGLAPTAPISPPQNNRDMDDEEDEIVDEEYKKYRKNFLFNLSSNTLKPGIILPGESMEIRSAVQSSRDIGIETDNVSIRSFKR